ncbi:MAG: hypothetical protein QM778_01770 [Myxococcales bacterium]
MIRALVSLACFALFALGSLVPNRAQAWEWFRSENQDARRGNELLEKGKADEATQAYEAAQRALPNDPGLMLNKGLGLLGAGKLPEARDAFRAASQGQASPELRGKANYNLGLTFLREADTLAKEEKLEEAQKALTESVDAFKSSLRNVPKNHDAAWNLELAKRRLVDLEQKKQQQEQEKKDQEQKDQQQNQDQQNQDQQNQDQQNQDQQNQDQQKPNDQNDQNKAQPEPKDQEPKGGDQQKPESKDKAGQDQAKAPEQQQAPEQQPQPQEPQERPGQKALPEHMQRALDALSESDDNLQKQRARARARQRPQRIEKDW